VVECAGCGLIRLYPWPTLGQLEGFYPGAYWFSGGGSGTERLQDLYRRFVLRDHLRFVERALTETGPGLVLDVGCGGGLFLRMLAERGHRVAGLDFSRDAASIAWHQSRVPATCATLAPAPFPDDSCAAVTMFHVLEHLQDPAEYLAGAHRLLKRDGRLVVQVPNAASWQFLLFGENWSGVDVPRHLINFRDCDLRLLLQRCGFEVVRLKYFSLRDNPAGFATSLAPGLDPMARRVRGIDESAAGRLAKDLLYFSITLAALPFALVEAACQAGSTVMAEARKRA
jgi:SAM-dependent methyltransferase